MENKTTLTFSYAGDGDENFYLTLSSRLAEMLSEYTVEWKHTYGRSTHQLKLRSKVLPLNQVLLDRKDLITKPYFHLFWVDCTDTNQYTYCVRGKIMLWLDQLSKCENAEWMLIVLVNDVLTRITKAKLPLKKSAIVDKIKSEFCHKNSDRIQILHEAMKETTKSGESWQALVAKVALTTTRSMENQVSAYEEKVRSERERRNEKSWDFCTYFLMQEELAFMYEMLGMFNSALVQYDELDAMFTQYIVNAKSGDIAHWLSRFSERPITDWNALLLWKPIDTEARRRIIEGSASLVDVRNYLFGRLCHLLIKMNQPHKVANRMYYFLHSISNEMKILEISVTEGAVDCWVFMCSLELVIALQRQVNLTNHSGHHSNGEATVNNSKDGSTSSNSASLDAKHKLLLLENAVLWNMARDKLFALGKLCGLLPGPKTSSAQLEKVVGLLSGMGVDEERNDDIKSPHSVLREALSSKSNFRRHYFELAELAMGTFKHMGRYRAARNIGAQLAEFYMLAGEPEQGESYLLEWSRMFAKDGWNRLQSHANEKLAACYKQSGNSRKYIRLCYELVCDTSRSTPCEKQQHYCDQLISFARSQLQEDYAVNLYPMAELTSVRFLPARLQFQRNSHQEVRLELTLVHTSPKQMKFDRMEVGVNKTPTPLITDNHHNNNRGRRQHRRGHSRNISNTSSVFKMTVDSEDDDEDDLNSSVNSRTPNENRHEQTRVRGQLSSGCSVKELPLDTFEMSEDGSIKVINLHQSNKRHENGLNGNFEEKVHNRDGEVSRTSLSCRHAKTILRRQDSTHSQFGKHAIHNKSITLEKCDDLIVLENIHLQRGRNQMSFKLNTQQSESFRISQIRLVIGKLFFVLPSVYPTIIYTISDKKPIFDVDTSHFNGGKLYSGLPFSIQMSVDLGDRHLNCDDEGCCLTIKAAMWLRVLCVHNCTITTSEGVRGQIDEDPIVESGTTTTRIRLPRAQPGCKVMMKAECVCDITDYHPTPSSTTAASGGGGNQLHAINTHRRTHSAPISTMKMNMMTSSFANPSLRHHHNMMVMMSTAMSDEDSTNNSIASEFVELTIEDRDLSPPPPSDTGSDVAEEDVVIEEHEMSEVALNDDVVGAEDAGDHDPVKPSMPTIVVDKMMEFLTPKKSSTNVTSQHSNNVVRSASAERISNEKRTRSPLARSSRESQHRRITRSVASPPDSLRFNIPQVKVNKSQHPTSPVNCSDIEATFTSPWSDVGAVTSLFSFHRPLTFAHTWNFSTKCKRYLSVSVENLTTDRILRLSNSSLKFINISPSTDDVTMTALNPPNISCELRPDHSCTFAWQVSSVPSCDVINAKFDVEVTTTNQHVTTGHVTKSATYLFEVENVKTIYSVTCHQTNSDELLRCGVMTSLTITVTRDRNDDGHTTTSAGQQLLMFQVIDKRGGWAVCGKSSGILTFPGPNTDEENVKNPFDTIKIDVMPLQTGYLHFPYVLLNRYVKRTSEFDEKLSSTDSPVLKPPKLKSFNHGEVFYIDQARRVRVVAPEQLDEHTHSTTL